ncbi:diguanylate cyclase, partial [Stenotrophomonas sp.]
RAARIGRELLQTLAALSIPWDTARLRIGASIGIAPLEAGMTVDEAVASADAQCYRAKAMGRNNVQVQGELGELPGEDNDAG